MRDGICAPDLAVYKKAAQARFDQTRMAADSDDSKAHASSIFRVNR
jgi:hypothetical protein